MKTRKAIFALLTIIPVLISVSAAYGKGCLKGAVVGGVAGHVAGHHAVAGAALGCAVGHHEAVKKEKAAAAQSASGATRPQ
ncbi:hypothetical protein [Paraburkholderia bryophila]|jgi:hypothetical protein|uniref:Glycine zipper 2TM protein n=1 Tax=Paraburkholderia bryophila TaxID=420952 RepID=A0A329B5F8_9BURK|nr:hypothetical protein [Paraburkholderia bryophila]RAS15623.1 hypothetical protein BX591_1592 [Paraburkholderia bryophila]